MAQQLGSPFIGAEHSHNHQREPISGQWHPASPGTSCGCLTRFMVHGALLACELSFTFTVKIDDVGFENDGKFGTCQTFKNVDPDDLWMLTFDT